MDNQALLGSTGPSKRQHGPAKLSIYLLEVADSFQWKIMFTLGCVKQSGQSQSLYFSFYFSAWTGEAGSRNIVKFKHTYFWKAFISYKNQRKSAK